MIPPHLFSFKQLKGLFLGSSSLRIRPAFGKFKFLWELLLRDVSISDEDVLHLIMACPVLERLTLLGIQGLNHLRIHASKLKCLLIDYGYEDIVIKDGGNLMVVTIANIFSEIEEQANLNWQSVIRSLSGGSLMVVTITNIFSEIEQVNLNWQSVIHSLSGLNSLVNLGLSGGLIKLLAADYGLERCPLRSDSLTSLYLHCVRFDSIEVLKVFLSFLTSCPNLQNLCFSVESAKGPKLILDFFQEDQGRFSFPKLKSVQMRYVFAMGSTLDYIEFVASHSPNLKEVIIHQDGLVELSSARICYIGSRFSKCCPHTAVQYLPAGPTCFI